MFCSPTVKEWIRRWKRKQTIERWQNELFKNTQKHWSCKRKKFYIQLWSLIRPTASHYLSLLSEEFHSLDIIQNKINNTDNNMTGLNFYLEEQIVERVQTGLYKLPCYDVSEKVNTCANWTMIVDFWGILSERGLHVPQLSGDHFKTWMQFQTMIMYNLWSNSQRSRERQ